MTPKSHRNFIRKFRAPALRSKSKTKQLRLDSMTGVNPKHTHGIGIWGNERVVMSIRVDKKLKKVFTEVTKALFGSTCNPIECYMATIVSVYQNMEMNGVNSSITIDIGEIKIERNLRERRKDNTVTPEVIAGAERKPTKCQLGKCDNEAAVDMIYQPKGQAPRELKICKFHATELSKTKPWRVKRLFSKLRFLMKCRCLSECVVVNEYM